MRLLSDFGECVRSRSLRHFFIPSFNLLSVKMTDEAQVELQRMFDILLQSGICIIKECKTLNKVWTECLHHTVDTTDDARTVSRNLLKNDVCMITHIEQLQYVVFKITNDNCFDFLILASQFINYFFMHHATYRTHIPSFAMRVLLTHVSIPLTYIPLQTTVNKIIYVPRRFLLSNVSGIDISTCRLWYSMLMTKCGAYRLSLRIINKVLSNISPIALYYSGSSHRHVSDETKHRYVEMFSGNDTRVTERARRVWMFDLLIMRRHMDMVPTAIQMELLHCDEHFGVTLSPFICVYYLMFLNYSGLCQYDNRDRALRQLIDVVNHPEHSGACIWHAYNIAGHCMLSVGKYRQARDMFMRSYELTLPLPALHRINAAQHYLQCLSHETLQ